MTDCLSADLAAGVAAIEAEDHRQLWRAGWRYASAAVLTALAALAWRLLV